MMSSSVTAVGLRVTALRDAFSNFVAFLKSPSKIAWSAGVKSEGVSFFTKP